MHEHEKSLETIGLVSLVGSLAQLPLLGLADLHQVVGDPVLRLPLLPLQFGLVLFFGLLHLLLGVDLIVRLDGAHNRLELLLGETPLLLFADFPHILQNLGRSP